MPFLPRKIQSFTLADFLSKTSVSSCDLMKVDIEGAEYDTFMNAAGVLRGGMLKHIALEIHPAVLAHRGLSATRLHEHMIACGYRHDETLGPYSFGK